MALNLNELSRTENAILDSKRELSKISESRWKALLVNDDRAALKARIEATEKTLGSCKTIATYLRNFSTPFAREIESRQEGVRKDFERVKRTKDPRELHAWIKAELIPLVNTSERMAHLAASSTYKMKGIDIDFHRWTSSRPGKKGRR